MIESREVFAQRAAGIGRFDGETISGIDLEGFSGEGLSFVDSVWTEDCRLHGVTLRGCDFSRAKLAGNHPSRRVAEVEWPGLYRGDRRPGLLDEFDEIFEFPRAAVKPIRVPRDDCINFAIPDRVEKVLIALATFSGVRRDVVVAEYVEYVPAVAVA